MIAQIIELSNSDVFEKYRIKYDLDRDIYYPGLLGIEIRSIDSDYFNELKLFLKHSKDNFNFIENINNQFEIFIHGNVRNFHSLAEKANNYNDFHHAIISAIDNYEHYDSLSYQIGGKQLNFNSPHVMGILNVTPDSFSDGGKYPTANAAAEYGIEMIDKGAEIIDIGGESSRPGAEPVSTDTECGRIIPVIQKILLERPNALISVDTTKSVVASKALQHGAVIINDISSLRNDFKMIDVVKKFNSSVVLMHMQGVPKIMQNNPEYENVVEEIYDFLAENAELARKAGINNIFIDPGIGFGKTLEHNLEIIKRLNDFKSLGYPILIGLSRKSFIGKILDLDVENRDIPTSMLEVLAIKNGARIIRTHNVELGTQVCKLLSPII